MLLTSNWATEQTIKSNTRWTCQTDRRRTAQKGCAIKVNKQKQKRTNNTNTYANANMYANETEIRIAIGGEREVQGAWSGGKEALTLGASFSSFVLSAHTSCLPLIDEAYRLSAAALFRCLCCRCCCCCCAVFGKVSLHKFRQVLLYFFCFSLLFVVVSFVLDTAQGRFSGAWIYRHFVWIFVRSLCALRWCGLGGIGGRGRQSVMHTQQQPQQ